MNRAGAGAEGDGLSIVGLFAGIGGLELGLERAGHWSQLVVENFEPAAHTLRVRFPQAKLESDVRDLMALPRGIDLVTAGFPCQDLSSVGRKQGIRGTRSSLVGEIFRLLEQERVPWVLLENVPFLLHLDQGRALRLITSALEELGYRWAYRIIDAAAFGLPQRRRRWFLLASLDKDPRDILLAGEMARPPLTESEVACGFYWTEGVRALGWAIDSVPPIKCGSTVGVASPPAIMRPNGEVFTPDIRDAERLQGFPEDWTKPAEEVTRPGYRWRLVGNAVSVPVAEWIGRRLKGPNKYDATADRPLPMHAAWPKAAWSLEDTVFESKASDTPIWMDRPHLEDFLKYDGKPLSPRATEGFLKRAARGNLRFAEGFLEKLAMHAQRQA
jgi:DNA (cytosine-5)-methyltransferase 1